MFACSRRLAVASRTSSGRAPCTAHAGPATGPGLRPVPTTRPSPVPGSDRAMPTGPTISPAISAAARVLTSGRQTSGPGRQPAGSRAQSGRSATVNELCLAGDGSASGHLVRNRRRQRTRRAPSGRGAQHRRSARLGTARRRRRNRADRTFRDVPLQDQVARCRGRPTVGPLRAAVAERRGQYLPAGVAGVRLGKRPTQTGLPEHVSGWLASCRNRAVGCDNRRVQAVVRRARPDDQPVITALVRRARLNPADLHWEQFVIGERDGRAVGVAQLRRHSDGTKELASLVVEPVHASTALRRKWWMPCSPTRPRLYALIDRRFAGHFYRWGFRQVGPGELPRPVTRTYLIGRAVTTPGSLLRWQRIRIVPLLRPAR